MKYNNSDAKEGFVLFAFLELPLCHMEISKLGVKLEPWLPAYAIATATKMQDLICNCELQPQLTETLDP